MTELSPRTLADIVVEAAGDKKAEDILVLNVSELTTIADLFVICTGRGERQVQTIADAVREKAKEPGREPLGVEGYASGRWIFIGAFLVNVSTPYGLGSSIGIAVGNTLEAVVAAMLVSRFAHGARAFERPHDVFKFAFLAGLLATNLSATIGTTTLGLFGLASWTDFGPGWFNWWLGDLWGGLLVGPTLVGCATDRS